MKKYATVLIINLMIIINMLSLNTQKAEAGDEACTSGQMCYPSRSYVIWTCQSCTWINVCVSTRDGTILGSCPCDAYSTCQPRCYNGGTPGVSCHTENGLAACDRSPGKCETGWQSQNCQSGLNSCNQPWEYNSWGCCGPSSATSTPTPIPAPTPTPSNQPTPTCTLSFTSGSGTLALGTSASYSVTATHANGTIDRIEFTVSQTNTVLTPATLVTDTSFPYNSTYTASNVGTATIIAKCIMGGQIKDSKQLTVTVAAPTTTVTANIYDQTAQAGSGCSSTTRVPFTPTISLTNKTPITANPATFTNVVSTPGTQAILSVTNTPSDWLPIPGCGGSSSTISFTATNYNTPINRNFYFTRQAEAWWQAAGGDVYAANSAINIVPSSATNPYTMTN